jgi:hypothetical protein
MSEQKEPTKWQKWAAAIVIAFVVTLILTPIVIIWLDWINDLAEGI